MGKATGFLEYQREENTAIPPCERIKSFNEFHAPMDEEARRRQGARCMDCGVPLCQSAMVLNGMVTGCPLHNLIPEWNHEIYEGHFGHALARLLKSNNFPEFTGRVCPALCEKACVLGRYDKPVTSHDNELFIIETAFQNGFMKPRIPKIRSGKKVAVIGSGPSGLAVADQLNHRGHLVTVYEREDRIGGLLMYGIPNMKLDKTVLERRKSLMEEEGVTFILGTDVGKDIGAEEILSEYDAVVLCCGAKKPRGLACGSPDTVKGIYYAVDFLKEATKCLLNDASEKSEDSDNGTGRRGTSVRKNLLNAKNRHVVIVGGGDTGNDCIATVLRQGCKSVTALEMMPKPPLERSAGNPWPQWPKTLKTDYGHEEAEAVFGKDPRIFSTTVKECITGKKGELKKIRTVEVRFEKGKLIETPGTERELPCDLLLIAAGFTGCEDYTADAFKVTRTERGVVKTDSYIAESLKEGCKVFSAGDMRRGQSLVVWAIAEGRACAREVDRFLMGYTSL